MQRIIQDVPAERRLEVIHQLDQAIKTVGDYVLFVCLSCVIATFGLVLNSGAVIIGAMLIAPLMSPIMGLALSLVRGDLRRVGRTLAVLLSGVAIAVVLSTMLGGLVSAGDLNFLEQLPAEITSRTRPTLFDLAIALAGGAAGAYALAQPNLSATLPGVAIATALMPPLCVAGLGVSQQRWDASFGAALLFLANLAAIIFAGSVVFTLVGFGPIGKARRGEVLPRALLLSSALMLIVAVPLAGFMIRIAEDAHENGLIREALTQELNGMSNGSRLVGFVKDWKLDHLNVEATVRSPDSISYAAALAMQRRIGGSLARPVTLTLLVVPVTLVSPAGATPAPSPTGDLSAAPTAAGR